MILPTKHSDSDRSVIVVGGLLLPELAEPTELGELWQVARDKGLVTSFSRLYAGVLLLFTIGAVELVEGRLRRTIQE